MLDNYEIETVREIAFLKSFSQTETLVGTLNTEQQEVLSEIVSTKWPKVRFKIGHLVPNKRDILNSRIEERRQIRHTVRLMLGLDPISEYEIQEAELDGTYGAVVGGVGGTGGAGGGAGEFGVFKVYGHGDRRSTETSGEIS